MYTYSNSPTHITKAKHKIWKLVICIRGVRVISQEKEEIWQNKEKQHLWNWDKKAKYGLKIKEKAEI